MGSSYVPMLHLQACRFDRETTHSACLPVSNYPKCDQCGIKSIQTQESGNCATPLLWESDISQVMLLH